MKRLIAAFLFLFLAATAIPAAAAASTFSVVKFDSHADGVDRVFDIEIANSSGAPVTLSGRLVTINVYDTNPPQVIPISGFKVPTGASSRLQLRWSNAPMTGLARTVLVLSDGTNPYLVESHDLWMIPALPGLEFLIALAVLVTLALVGLRLPKFLKERVPENMVAYFVEPGDTVVSVSVRYGVTWQEIVKANRLRPPYALKAGLRIFIPKHPLEKPADAGRAEAGGQERESGRGNG